MEIPPAPNCLTKDFFGPRGVTTNQLKWLCVWQFSNCGPVACSIYCKWSKTGPREGLVMRPVTHIMQDTSKCLQSYMRWCGHLMLLEAAECQAFIYDRNGMEGLHQIQYYTCMSNSLLYSHVSRDSLNQTSNHCKWKLTCKPSLTTYPVAVSGHHSCPVGFNQELFKKPALLLYIQQQPFTNVWGVVCTVDIFIFIVDMLVQVMTSTSFRLYIVQQLFVNVLLWLWYLERLRSNLFGQRSHRLFCWQTSAYGLCSFSYTKWITKEIA